MNTLKQLLKGKWNYNIKDNKLICRNHSGLTYVFENKDNFFFQELLTTLNRSGRANPELNVEYESPEVQMPLELFHRVLRSNEVIYEQLVGLRQSPEGLFCFSEYTKDFKLNHHEYDDVKQVYIDPQRMCKITRRIRDRERVRTKIAIEDKRIVLECEFPWTTLIILMPTVPANMG